MTPPEDMASSRRTAISESSDAGLRSELHAFAYGVIVFVTFAILAAAVQWLTSG